MKKKSFLLSVIALLITLTIPMTTVFAAPMQMSGTPNGTIIVDGETKVLYVLNDTTHRGAETTPVQPLSPVPLASWTITVTDTFTHNGLRALTDFVANRYHDSGVSVSYTQGQSHTISANFNTNVGVSVEVIQASLGATFGVSATFTNSTTVTYPVAKGTAGQIISRFTRQYYAFTLSSGSRTGTGSGYTKATNQYYDYQYYVL